MMRDNLILHVVEGSIAQYSINPYEHVHAQRRL